MTTFKKFNVSPTLTKSEQWITKVKREVKFLYGLDHPSVATIYGMVLDIGNIGIVMEHFPRSLCRKAGFPRESEDHTDEADK